MIHPADTIVHAGRVGRGLAKGGGVLLGWTTGYYPVKESQGVTTSWRRGENGCAGRFLWVKPTLGVDFGDVVAHTTHANVPLRHQSWERTR